ncbi:DUF389 domain-containing protein [Verrucomicrobiaceae bacterium 227]
MSVSVVVRNESEANFLKELGLRIAGAWDEPLEIWAATSGKAEASWIKALEGAGVALVRDLSGVDRKSQVIRMAKQEWPRLVVVGKSPKAASNDADRRFSRNVFEEVCCQVFAVRLGLELSPPNSRILVPSAGGRHSRRALKLAHALSPLGTVAFQMRPDSDELSTEVGLLHLERMLGKAGVPADDVLTKVVLGDDFNQALSQEVASEDYGLLVIGASSSGTLRRKLFGSIPDRILKDGDGLTVGVIRAEHSKGHRFRDLMGRLVHVNIPQLNRNERLTLFEEVESKSRWNFDFAALMSLATAIAAMGLLVNSGAVVIGAMLVAPLMMPLIGTGLSLVQGNWPLCKQALGAVVRGFCFALVLGLGMGVLARFLELGLTDQLRMRGEPNTLDLGIAFVSGIAASYCIARPKLSGALAGVAIAAALVPPIATVGICLALGETSVAKGAALLFGTNIVAIVLGAGLNFLLAGIRGKHKTGEWGRRGLIVLLLVCFGLAVPLTSVLLSRLAQSSELEMAVRAELPKGVRLVSVSRRSGGGFEVTLESPGPLSDSTLAKVKTAIEIKEARETKVRLRTHLVREK